MSWLDQGRQEHGWFGSGITQPEQGDGNDLLAPAQAGKRIEYAAFSIIGHVPRGDRNRWTSALDGYRADQLKAAFAGWFGAADRDRNSFRDLLLQPGTPDEVVHDIRAAARDVADAGSQDDLSRGAAALASAAQAIGPGKWPQCVGDSGRRAEAAIADGSVPGVTQVAGTDTAASAFAGMVIAGGAMIWLLGRSGSGGASKVSRSPLVADLPVVVMATPPRDAKDPNGAKAPGKPTAEDGFKDPKGGENWVPNPNRRANDRGYGWLAANGDVWVPSGQGDGVHGVPHWDVQTPGKGYRNVKPSQQEQK